jgi:hypothetical protein
MSLLCMMMKLDWMSFKTWGLVKENSFEENGSCESCEDTCDFRGYSELNL